MNPSDAPWMRDMLLQLTQKGSRSTALNPLGWILVVLCPASIAAHYAGAPLWLRIIFGAGAAVGIAIYFASYIYLLFKNPEALRSEQYNIQRLAIEKGIVGDSTTGIIEPEPTDLVISQLQISSSTSNDSGEPSP